MSFLKEIIKLKMTMSSHGDGGNNGSDWRASGYKKNNGFVFFIACLGSAIFFVFFGIYEIVFRSPLASWFSSAWKSVLKTSPQSLSELPSKISGTENIMQKSIGDWLGLAPGLLGQIWDAIVSPAGAVLGLVIIICAFCIRLSNKFINKNSEKQTRRIKIVAWLVLTGSFVPLLLEYCL